MKKRLTGIVLASLMMVSMIPGVQAASDMQEWKTESTENEDSMESDINDDAQKAETDLSGDHIEEDGEESDVSFEEENEDSPEAEEDMENSDDDMTDEIQLEEDIAEEEMLEAETIFSDDEELISTYGASNIPVDWVSADYKMPEEYAFTYAFRKDVTELAYISRTNSTLNNKIHNWFGDGMGYTQEYCRTFYAAAIDDTTNTDPITAIYSNVGEYQGQIVDLRVTVPRWGAVNKNHVGKDGKKITPCIMFYKDRIAFNTVSVGIVRFKFEFLRHNTDEQIYPKGHVTAADLDGGQGIRVYDYWGVDHIYLRSGYDYLKVETGATANGSGYREVKSSEGSDSLKNSDVKGWCQLDFNGSFTLNWLAQDSWKNSTGVQNAFYVSTGQPVGTYEPNPGPEKRVGDELEYFESMNRHEFTQDDPPYEITPEGYFDYVISQRLLPGTYESFVLTDELDPCLRFLYATVETSLGNIVTEYFDIEENDGTIVFRADPDFLKTDEAYNDVTYYFRIRVQAGTLEEINAHDHYQKSDEFFSIANKASRTIVSDRMRDTQDTNESWVKGNPGFDDGEIIVTKKIKEADITWAHGNPVFRFRITGRDQQGISHVYEDYVEFAPGTYNISGTDAVMTCVFKGIQAGHYTISELPTLRYQFESITADTENVSISEKTGIASIDSSQKRAAVTFRNKKTRYDRYSHTDVVRNTIPLA